MCKENFWLMTAGVQWLELLENWMEVRKISHIAQTGKNKRFRDTKQSVIVTLMEK